MIAGFRGLLLGASPAIVLSLPGFVDIFRKADTMSRMAKTGGRRPRRVLSEEFRAVAFFSSLKSALPDRFDSYGEARKELFDYIGVFDNQKRRHSTIGQISPAAFDQARATRAAWCYRTLETRAPQPIPNER